MMVIRCKQESRLKGHVPLCLVLVIDDNLYGLMVSLSYTLRFVHRQRLKIIWWLQGCKMKITCRPRCSSWSYPKIGQVDVFKVKRSITKISYAWSLPTI